MASDKALYWLAVGVMGFTFLQSASVRFQDRWDDFETRALQAAEQLSDHASGYLSMAEMQLGMHTTRYARMEAVATRMQTRMACAQATIARQQAGFARAEAARARVQVKLARVEATIDDE
jgi:hypothetical protein